MLYHGHGCYNLELPGSVSDHFMSCLKQKRRQKINERLRILQELIPNGTKVISY
jgi:hypothetical protein